MNTTGTERFTLRRGPLPYDSVYRHDPGKEAWLLILDEKYLDEESCTWEGGELSAASARAWAQALITSLTRDTVHVTGWRDTGDGVLEADYQLVRHTILLHAEGWTPAVRTCVGSGDAEQVIDQVNSGLGLIGIDPTDSCPFYPCPLPAPCPGHPSSPAGASSSRGEYMAARIVTRVIHYRTVTDRPTAG